METQDQDNLFFYYYIGVSILVYIKACKEVNREASTGTIKHKGDKTKGVLEEAQLGRPALKSKYYFWTLEQEENRSK